MARLFVPLVAANLLAWGLAFALFHGSPLLLGAGVLAYTFGLRHAVDADHIAAIDGVTRKLVHTGQRPRSAGLFFSLGHSAVVWLASPGIALAANSAAPRMEFMRRIGGTLGMSVSLLFLSAIALANVLVLRDILAAMRRHRRGEAPARAVLDGICASRGVYGRLLQPAVRMVSQPRHMLLVGFLFGLGFDTATEIGVLGISAAAASRGISIWSILIFPALFTAGMSLVDTLDSALMTGAYGWACVDSVRKLHYNLAVTFFSVVTAVLVGGMEACALVGTRLGESVPLQGLLGRLSEALSQSGYRTGLGIGATFAALWLASVLLHRHVRVH
jgi:high-affinity nickel-transport protein